VSSVQGADSVKCASVQGTEHVKWDTATWEVDVRLPGKGNSNSHGARPVHQTISMMKWIRTRNVVKKNCLSAPTARYTSFISWKVFCIRFSKGKSPTKPSTYCLLFLVLSLGQGCCQSEGGGSSRVRAGERVRERSFAPHGEHDFNRPTERA
jgi:hypothetical protein